MMKQLMTILVVSVALVGLGTVNETQAQERVLLGERHVSDRSEKDTIFVGKKDGRFRGLQIKVSGAAVEFKRVIVHFENGSKQVFEKNRLVGKGDRTRVINLEGGRRFIDKVVFHYEARSRGWKGADIKLWGVR